MPKEVRKLLKLEEGAVVVFEKEHNEVVLKTAKTLKDFKGVLKGKGVPEGFMVIREKAYLREKSGFGRKKQRSRHSYVILPK